MALDREQIERKDFPIGRRGYDPTEVDAHLTALATQVDELRRSSRRRTEALAATASEQVREIVEAAESSAAQIQRQAEADAQEIRGEASADANAARVQATSRAREYVGKVSESTVAMLERLEVMQNELSELMESLRTGGTRLNESLQALERQLEEVRESAAPRLQFGSDPAPRFADGEPLADSHDTASIHGEPLADDLDDARLIALNMALNGSSREDTERYLAENFDLHDRHGLVDQVYASVEG